METMGKIMNVYAYIYFGISLDKEKVDFTFSLATIWICTKKMFLVLKTPSKSNKIKTLFSIIKLYQNDGKFFATPPYPYFWSHRTQVTS
jgi:hypothetical protein